MVVCIVLIITMIMLVGFILCFIRKKKSTMKAKVSNCLFSISVLNQHAALKNMYWRLMVILLNQVKWCV